MIITTDDVCPENLKFFPYWDEIKKMKPDLKLIAFVIANYKYEQDVSKSDEFKSWYKSHKDWVEIGVHGYDHLEPPEQERDDAEELVVKSLEILKPFLPQEKLYRPPGFQRTIHTEPMIRKLGFDGIAFQNRFKMFDGRIIEPIFNTHCSGEPESIQVHKMTDWKKWINQIL